MGSVFTLSFVLFALIIIARLAIYIYRRMGIMFEKMIGDFVAKKIDDIDFGALAIKILKNKLAAYDPAAFADRVINAVGPELETALKGTAEAVLDRLEQTE